MQNNLILSALLAFAGNSLISVGQIFFHERLSWFQWTGVVLIIVGMVFINTHIKKEDTDDG